MPRPRCYCNQFQSCTCGVDDRERGYEEALEDVMALLGTVDWHLAEKFADGFVDANSSALLAVRKLCEGK